VSRGHRVGDCGDVFEVAVEDLQQSGIKDHLGVVEAFDAQSDAQSELDEGADLAL